MVDVLSSCSSSIRCRSNLHCLVKNGISKPPRIGALEDSREMIARELQEFRGQRASVMRPSVLASLVSGDYHYQKVKKQSM